MRITKLVSVGLLVVLAISLGGCASDKDMARQIQEQLNSLVPEEVDYTPYLIELDKPKIEKDTFYDYVVGSFVNNSTVTFDYVQIHIAIYDKEGNQIDTVWKTISDLLPGNIWKYKAGLLTQDAYRAEIVEIKVDVWPWED